VLRACGVIERAGVPTIAIASTGFLLQARAIRKALKIDHVRIVEYPGVIPTDDDATFVAKVQECIVPEVTAWLEGERGAARDAVADAEETATWQPAFRGTYDEVLDEYHRRMWTDGLPIVPPTPEAVRRMLSFADRDPDEVLGVLPPELREATVYSVAVNAVMAGCAPELFPVALAAVECIADPGFRLQDGGSTPGWEPLIVLSGPRFADIGLVARPGQMRVGNPATASLGRFLRLGMRNIAGLRTHPGATDKGSFGYTFNVAMPEDREATLALGWGTLGEDLGFARDDDVVMVQSVVAISPPIYSGGATGKEQLETIEHIFGATMGPFAFTGVWFDHWHPLLAMSPAVAQVFARDGWTKDDLRRHFYDNLTIEGDWFDRYPLRIRGTAALTMRKLVEDGKAPARYWESDDPSRRLPMLREPDWTNIILAGDPGRNQSRAYINCHEQGAPVARAVRWPVR
jgi:hypothetical protein